MDSYYNGAWRMDWGLDNPNKTAVLIACLMVAVWSIALIWKKGFWIALVIATALGWCLVETYSRGGMIGFLCGMAVLLAWTPRPWPKTRLIGASLALWVLGAFVLLAKAQMRYGQGLFSDDRSIDNRLAIWSHVPAMLATASWGWANAGDAYTQWFQPAGESVTYLNLINSHFNFMVEGGWLGSVLYLFAWWMVLLLCWPTEKFRIGAIPLATWATFGVGACFSDVASSPWLWLVPVCAVAYAVRQRVRLARWPDLSIVMAGGAVSVAVVTVLVGIGNAAAILPIREQSGFVVVGSGKTATMIFVDRKVMGSLYGHTFRKFLARDIDALRDGKFIFVETAQGSLAQRATQLVVTGRFAEDAALMAKNGDGCRIILINPSGIFDQLQSKWSSSRGMTVYFGEYSDAPSRSAWRAFPGIKAVQADGAADFVPSWPDVIWNASRS